MATTSIKASRNGAGSLHYILKSKAKNTDDVIKMNDRVLASNFVNCSKRLCKQQMQSIWKRQRTSELRPIRKYNKLSKQWETKMLKGIETYNLRVSFSPDELDYKNKSDWEKAKEICTKIAKRLYPNCLSSVVIQADGKGHKVHGHIDVCNYDVKTGKAIRGALTKQGTLAYVSDEECLKAGLVKSSKLKHVQKGQLKTTSGLRVNRNKQNLSRKNQNSFLVELQQNIMLTNSKEHPTNFDDLISGGKKHNLDVHVRKNKKGEVNGLSFKLIHGGSKRAVRGKTLGTDFMKEHFEQLFETNKLKLQQQRIQNLNTRNRIRKEEEQKDTYNKRRKMQFEQSEVDNHNDLNKNRKDAKNRDNGDDLTI